MKHLQQYGESIGEKESVLAVILHGSLVHGTYTGSSDADIIVVVDEAQEPFHRRASAFMKRDLPIALDIMVYTLDELRSMKEQGARHVVDALDNSCVLYGGEGWESLRL
jgi:predicted nucleotidyltransferase